MNRIILIGNGFDLAHGLKTSYRDFIDDYWKKVKNGINNSLKGFFFENDDVKFSKLHENIYDGTSPFYVSDFSKDVKINFGKYYNNITFKNQFLKIITEKTSLQNWVDIEEEYYKLLQETMNKNIPSNKKTYSNIKQLNNDFSRIKEELANYLIRETTKGIGGNAIEFVNKTISNNIYSNFESRDLTVSDRPSTPESILFLSFNYSNTENLYFNEFHEFFFTDNKKNIHIHGELKKTKNPIIFGYGDEIGKEYEEIENLNNNDFLENIKSIRYSDTSNYKRLLDYINSDEYQIFLFGHSCGLSDRTLLNTLFEHENCVSIKPFFYEWKDEQGVTHNNYSDIVRNISRHFKDKAMMREKVVNKEYCKPLS